VIASTRGSGKRHRKVWDRCKALVRAECPNLVEDRLCLGLMDLAHPDTAPVRDRLPCHIFAQERCGLFERGILPQVPDLQSLFLATHTRDDRSARAQVLSAARELLETKRYATQNAVIALVDCSMPSVKRHWPSVVQELDLVIAGGMRNERIMVRRPEGVPARVKSIRNSPYLEGLGMGAILQSLGRERPNLAPQAGEDAEEDEFEDEWRPDDELHSGGGGEPSQHSPPDEMPTADLTAAAPELAGSPRPRGEEAGAPRCCAPASRPLNAPLALKKGVGSWPVPSALEASP
jgi:hypothetical protein